MSAMKIKFGKDKKEMIILSVLIIVVIAVVYFQLLFRPAIGRLRTLLPQTSALKKSLVEARSLVANKDILEKEKEKLQLRLDKHKEIFPSQQEIPRLLEKLSGIADESRVKIISIKPLDKEASGGAEKDGVYQEIPIKIVAKSSYHQLGRFLQNLETGDRFMMVKDLKIRANENKPKKHNVELTVSTYILVIE